MFVIPTWTVTDLAIVLCIILFLSFLIKKDQVALVLFLAFTYFTTMYSTVDKFPPEETRFLVRLGFLVLFTSLIFVYGKGLFTKDVIIFIKNIKRNIEQKFKIHNWRK